MPVSLKKFYNDKLGKDVDVKTYWFDKTMKPLAVLYGCFAPFTGKEGHGRLLATAAKNGIKDFIVMMPNKDDSNAEGRTMFTNKQKVDIVEKGVKALGYNLLKAFVTIGYDSPKRLLRNIAEEYPDRRIVLICGPDREEQYSKFCVPYKKNNEIPLEKSNGEFEYILNDPGKRNIRGTAVRQAIVDGDAELFMYLTGYDKSMWDLCRGYYEKNLNGGEEAHKEADEGAYAIVKKIAEYIHNIKNPMTDKPNELWIVGGAVRDELMGKKSNDLDLITTCSPKFLQSLSIFDECESMVRGGKNVMLPVVNGVQFETNCIKPYQQALINNLEERDITANAMARNVITNEIVDPTGGQKDIKNKICRATEINTEQFRQGKQPARILRVIRFSCIYGWKIAKDTMEAMKEFGKVSKGKLVISQVQFDHNWEKIVKTKTENKAIDILKEIGIYNYVAKHFLNNTQTESFNKVGLKNFTQYLIEHTNPSLQEKFVGSDLVMYNSSKDPHFEQYFFDKTLRFANNAGNMYGLGIYTVLEMPKDSGTSFSDKFRDTLYGTNVYELKAPSDKFFYFLYDYFVKSALYTKLGAPTEDEYIKKQFEYFGIEMPNDEMLYKMTPNNDDINPSKAAYYFYKYMHSIYYQRKDGSLNCPITGFVYFGKNDGYVGVVWAPYRCTLTRKLVDGKWEKIKKYNNDGNELDDIEERIFDGHKTKEKEYVYRLLQEYRGENTPLGNIVNIRIHDDKTFDFTFKANNPQADGYRHCYILMDNPYMDKVFELGYRIGTLDGWLKMGNSTQGKSANGVMYLPSNAPKAIMPQKVTQGIYLTGMDNIDSKEIRACKKINVEENTLVIRKSVINTNDLGFENVFIKDCLIEDKFYDAIVDKYNCVDKDGNICVKKVSVKKAEDDEKARLKAEKEAEKLRKEEEKKKKAEERARKAAEKETEKAKKAAKKKG